MTKPSGIDLTKQSSVALGQPQFEEQVKERQDWHEGINKICSRLSLSTDAFNAKGTYELIEEYISQYGRWLYSDISGYLFNCTEEAVSTFLTNLDTLQLYAHKLLFDSKSNRDKKRYSDMTTAIDKLWDHSNLAQKQNISLHDSEESFKARFDKNLIPFEARFSQDMHEQFISLIAIFTALSFIVFGGISVLDNIFSGVTSIPILELIIIGCIWSLCIANLVFTFMLVVSKLTKISIKSSSNPVASISEKYPFMVWSNFLLLLIFCVTCLLYYIDYSDSGGWILSLSRSNEILFSLGGLFSITMIFTVAAHLLLKRRTPK